MFSDIRPELHPEISGAFPTGRKSSPQISPDFPIRDSEFQIKFQINFTKDLHKTLLQAWQPYVIASLMIPEIWEDFSGN